MLRGLGVNIFYPRIARIEYEGDGFFLEEIIDVRTCLVAQCEVRMKNLLKLRNPRLTLASLFASQVLLIMITKISINKFVKNTGNESLIWQSFMNSYSL